MSHSDGKPLVVIGYRRVSTDRQEADRQASSAASWATRENALIPEWFEDVDVSGKVNPFKREGFLAACDRAREIGAKGILVETADRFTRSGTRLYFVYAFQLEEKYGLKLYEADQTVENQHKGLGEIMSAMKAMAAKDWLDTHSRRMSEVAAKKKAKGERMGRPPKTFDRGETEFILRHRDGPGERKSWDWIANELCKTRGAFDVTDRLARSRRMVSEGQVRRAYRALKAVESLESVKSREDKVEAA